MTGKHTRGPWSVESDERVEIFDAAGGRVATCNWLSARCAGPRRTSDEVHANARLIAAAPAMLAALRLARDAMHQTVRFGRAHEIDQDDLNAAIDAADAAIKAAEGRG